MLERLGRFLLRRRWAVLAATLAVVVAAGVFGGSAITRLKAGGFDDPDAESTRAAAILRDEFGAGDPNLVLLVTAKGGDVDDPAVAAAGQALTRRLAAEPDLAQVVSYWASGAPALKSTDGGQALVLGRITGDEDDMDERAAALTAAYTRDDAALSVQVGGQAEVFREVGEQVESDLARAETIAVPITLILLVLVFGSVVAGVAAAGRRRLRRRRHLPRAAGPGRGHRRLDLRPQPDHRAGPRPGHRLQPVHRLPLPRGAAGRPRAGRRPGRAPCSTAGRTVLFSAATVAVSLAALLVFPLVLPALLRLRRHRRGRPGRGRRRGRAPGPAGRARPPGRQVAAVCRTGRPTPGSPATGFWHRIAIAVMRRPRPGRHWPWSPSCSCSAPRSCGVALRPARRPGPARRAPRPPGGTTPSATDFATDEASALSVVAPGIGDAEAHVADDRRLRRRPVPAATGVARVDALTGSYAGGAGSRWRPRRRRALEAGASPRADGTWLSVVPVVEPYLARPARTWSAAVRGLPTPRSSVQVDRRLGRAGRHQGVAVRPPAARRRPHRPGHLRRCCS